MRAKHTEQRTEITSASTHAAEEGREGRRKEEGGKERVVVVVVVGALGAEVVVQVVRVMIATLDASATGVVKAARVEVEAATQLL